jgi:hypothetical protein
MNTKDFSEGDRDVLRELYSGAERTLDDLPYTHEFEALYADFLKGTGRLGATRHDVWKALSALRKRSELVRKKR